MKIIYASFLFISLVTVGCSHTSDAPKYPCYYSESTEPPPMALPRKEDSFDKTGEVLASSSRWVYNKSTQAYEWVMSPENKERASKAWETTKAEANSAFEKAIQVYQDYRGK